MEAAVLSALAAVGGSTVGALTPLINNYFVQKSLTKREVFNHQLAQRESLYSDFILAASKMYAHSVSNTLDNLDELVALYAIVSRIRLVSSESVLHAAEELVLQIVRHYGDPNMDFEHIRAALLQAKADPLMGFSIACRDELAESVRRGIINDSVRSTVHPHS